MEGNPKVMVWTEGGGDNHLGGGEGNKINMMESDSKEARHREIMEKF